MRAVLCNEWGRIFPALGIAGVIALALGTACGKSGGANRKIRRPEVEVVSFDHSVSGAAVAYTVDLRNSGGREAASFSLHLYYDRAMAPAAGDLGDDLLVVASLPAGTTQTYTFARSGTPPGIYSSWVQADAAEVLEEIDRTDNVGGPITVEVVLSPGVDLAVAAFSASASGSDVTYLVDVVNLGATDSGLFSVDLYFDRAGAPTTGAPGDLAQSIASLAGGATLALNFVRPFAPVGTYSSWVQVDTLDAQPEDDETNNVDGPIPVIVGSNDPELAITSFAASVSGTTVDYSVEVTNAGTSDAGGFSLDLYYDLGSSPMAGMPGDDSMNIPGLMAGNATMVSFTRSTTPAGTYDSWAQVDTFDTVLEANETDNVAGPETVTVAAGLPDLTITSLTHSIITPTSVVYTVDVHNPSAVDITTPFEVHLYYDRAMAPAPGDIGDNIQAINALAAGNTQSLVFNWFTATSGTHDAWALADGTGVVAEADETNNVAGPESVLIP